jgi:protease-4
MTLKKASSMSFSDILKNIFFLLVLLQFLPLLINGIRKQYSKYLEPTTQVGVVQLKGVLYNSAPYTKQLQSFFKDPAIKAILLDIDCSGSAAGTGQILFREIMEYKKEYAKPVVARVENVCASGGYWIACAADTIIAPETALIGSIGAYFPYLFQLKDFVEQYKIKYTSIKAGTYKAATDPFTNITDAERAMLQEALDDTYDQFAQSVASARKLSMSSIQDWADGKIFTGRQALKLGLIDHVGSPQTAVAVLKEKALIEGEIEWIQSARSKSFLSYLFGSDEDDGSMVASAMNSAVTTLEQRISAPRV